MKKSLKQQLSDEISKGKRKKNRRDVVMGLALVTLFDTGILISGYILGTKDLKGWAIACAVILAVGTFLGLMTLTWEIKKDPTDDELRALAQKKIDRLDMSEDMTGETDQELRKELQKILEI